MALDKQLHFAAGLLITISVGFYGSDMVGRLRWLHRDDAAAKLKGGCYATRNRK